MIIYRHSPFLLGFIGDKLSSPNIILNTKLLKRHHVGLKPPDTPAGDGPFERTPAPADSTEAQRHDSGSSFGEVPQQVPKG